MFTDEDDVPYPVHRMCLLYSANELVYSRENNTDVRSIVPKRPCQADFTNASPFHHC